ncbi:hypothetical protein [Nostoc sp.]|uniref:hypothetical protein n=1 Tax=Nostoc sp. TaxID=1180 RepID=UPI002FFAF77B
MTSDTKPIFDPLADEGSAIDWNGLLTEILAAFDCSTGTIHTLDQDSQLLHLKAYQGIPEFLLPKMTVYSHRQRDGRCCSRTQATRTNLQPANRRIGSGQALGKRNQGKRLDYGAAYAE